MTKKIWRIKELNSQAQELAKKYNLPCYLVQVLINRDIAERDFGLFLNSSQADFHDPNLLPDIQKAVERIKLASHNKEKVLVFGDYDVDGITSLVIFNEYAKNFPESFSFYIPHRIKDGYGLNREAILRAKEERISLILAFDCGTNGYDEVKLAQSLGIDVVVVDHHLLKGDQGLSCALVNPKRNDSEYPFSELSTGALSFKLLQLLVGKDCHEVLDLVALSLICDVVPLNGENRILLKEGLRVLKLSQRSAIIALCKVSGIKQRNIDTFHVGYILGPRINASGRVAHANDSFKLFLTENQEEAFKLATKLSEYNKLRKNIETQILKEAEQHLQNSYLEHSAIVVSGDNWHQGVLGIVASRLADKYRKPTFVISFDQEVGKGSARSIHSVHLLEMLDQCADSLIGYGGHRKAAGVHIAKAELENFRDKISTLIEESLSPEDFIPVLDIDAKLNFCDISIELAESLENLKPYGEGNSAGQFFSSNIFKKSVPKRIGYGSSVWLSDGDRTYEAIIYDKNILEIMNSGDKLDIVFTLGMNTYHNIPRLVIRGARLSGGKG
ncbi:MAG: single-stranded-DNA-specific exonuclease RecJ [Candidatus Omnitrophica bacterium]|nr:single-stranded-DNA-specific exonuclease RecJ [Candidatus Omnitrophota bacterium]